MPNNEKIKPNEVCWVDGCNEKIKEWPYCKEHLKQEKVKLKFPAVGGNNPNIPK